VVTRVQKRGGEKITETRKVRVEGEGGRTGGGNARERKGRQKVRKNRVLVESWRRVGWRHGPVADHLPQKRLEGGGRIC